MPVFLSHIGTTLGLLILGIAAYEAITPYREVRLIREGNTAAGIALSGAILGLAIPLAVCMANSVSVGDILVWGAVALILQLAAFFAVSLILRGLPAAIERGEIASALFLATVQLATSLIIAAALIV